MKRTNPHGRTPLLGPAGKPLPDFEGDREAVTQYDPEAEAAARAAEQRSPRAWRSGIPLHRGAISEQEVQRLKRIGEARREGNDPIPSWQRTLRAGCTSCMARPGLLPADHEKARRLLLEWGWRWEGGRWICPRCQA